MCCGWDTVDSREMCLLLLLSTEGSIAMVVQHEGIGFTTMISFNVFMGAQLILMPSWTVTMKVAKYRSTDHC